MLKLAVISFESDWNVQVKHTFLMLMALLCLVWQEKCFQYWPEKGCWIYGNIRVAMEDVTVLVDYTIRKFCIQYVSKMSFQNENMLVFFFIFIEYYVLCGE